MNELALPPSILRVGVRAMGALAAAAVLASAPASAACRFHNAVDAAVLSGSSTTVVGLKGGRLVLEGFNLNKERPAWEGPLRVVSGKRSCVIDVSIIAGVFVDARGETAIVETASGSEGWAAVYRLRDCKTLLPEKLYAGYDARESRLQRRPFCYDDYCYRGLRYDFDAECRPTLNEKESDRWTLETLGETIPDDSVKAPEDSPMRARSKAADERYLKERAGTR